MNTFLHNNNNNINAFVDLRDRRRVMMYVGAVVGTEHLVVGRKKEG